MVPSYLSYLGTNAVAAAGNGKYKKVVDYIPRSQYAEEEVSLGDGLSLRLGSSAKRPKLENVTPAQWIIANTRILAEMLSETGHADQAFLDAYLIYTIKMGELATRFTWASVLSYDDDYRRRQWETKFQWGADAPHLSTIMLKEREAPKAPFKQSTHKASPESAASKAKYRHCGFFNSGKDCPYGLECRFPHVCATCGRNHSRVDHTNEAGKPRATPGSEE
jgi:hypothetical protein